MAKVLVAGPERAKEGCWPAGVRGQGRSFAQVSSDGFPLELHRAELTPGQRLQIGPRDVDTVLYVWRGAVGGGMCSLPSGSSVIVERGASFEITASMDGAELLVFAGTSAGRGEGGHVHLLPKARVPALDDMGGAEGTGGAIHADSDCPTCEVWLHENHFKGAEPPTPDEAARGIHSHSEDEIIVVLAGAMRLGNKLVGPGTALAIAADTLYSFTPGPEGLSFVNFRARRPGDIRFTNGPTMNETGLWRDLLPRPQYLEPVG
jgi:hypothetical protein